MPEDMEALENLFDKWAANYDSSVGGDAGLFAGYEDTLDETARLAEASAGMRVLDIGIGTGGLAERLARCGADVWGIDISTEMLKACAEKFPQFRLEKGDFLHIPFDSSQFHRVVSSFALHHVQPGDYESVIGEVLRVLAPGGRFVLTDFMFASQSTRREAASRLGERWDDEEEYPIVPHLCLAASLAGATLVQARPLAALHWAVFGGKPE